MITNKILFRLSIIFLYTFIIGFVCFAQYKTALAATHLSGYQIAVTESVPTMNYGESSPTFKATLTVPTDEPPISNPDNFSIRIDGHDYSGGSSISGTAPHYSLYLNNTGDTPLSVGQHSVVAVYYSAVQGATIESTPIILTVLKNTPTLDCFIAQLSYNYAPNTPLTISLSFGGTNAPVNWQSGTETISFVGTRTFTYPNLKPNSSIQVFVSTPPVVGEYNLRCIFNGTNSFNSTEADTHVTVSTNKQAAIKLYTNPTTLKSGVPTTWYVEVLGATGLPTPTGDISISIGSSYTRQIALGSDGTVTARGITPFLTGTTIKILYFGDTVYKWYDTSFPLTNPPPPTTKGSTSSPASSNNSSPSTTASGNSSPSTTANVAKAAATPTSLHPSTAIAKASNSGFSSTPIAAHGIGTGATENNTSGSNITKPSANQDIRRWIVLGAVVSFASSGMVGIVALRRRSIAALTTNDKRNS